MAAVKLMLDKIVF